MELLKEFDNADIHDLMESFSKWEKTNIKINHGQREKNVELTYGLPYTSGSTCAGLWCTNVSAVYTNDSSLRFDGIGYTTEFEPVAFFTRLDESGNEVEDVLKLL